MTHLDTWTRTARTVVTATTCAYCHGWGGYWFGKTWKRCDTCNGSGTT